MVRNGTCRIINHNIMIIKGAGGVFIKTDPNFGPGKIVKKKRSKNFKIE